MEYVYIVVAVLIFSYISGFYDFVIDLLTMFIPGQVLPYILIALVISILQYFISRKDD